jgi:hypothetical protein
MIRLSGIEIIKYNENYELWRCTKEVIYFLAHFPFIKTDGRMLSFRVPLSPNNIFKQWTDFHETWCEHQVPIDQHIFTLL